MFILMLALVSVDSIRAQPVVKTRPTRPILQQVTPSVSLHLSEANHTHRLGTLLESSGILSSWWTDGYSLRLVDDLSGPLGPPPVIEIDGMPMPIQSFGRTHLAALPVSAFDIRSMSWTPGIRSSGFQSGGRHAGSSGILSMSTITPEGTTLRGSVVLVNDTGDPGPDRYRSGGRNVDRSGPRASLRASVHEGSWFVEAALDADEHHMTDERIVRRIYRVYAAPVQPVIRVFHPHGRIRYSEETVLVDVRAGHLRADDFLFIDEIAQEWPHRQSAFYIAGRADWNVDDSWTAGFTTALRRSEFESRDMSVAGPPQLLVREGSARASLVRAFETGSTTLAAGVRSEEVDQRGPFNRQVDTRSFAEIRYDRELSSSTSISIDLNLAHPIDIGPDPGLSSSAASITFDHRVDGVSVSAGSSVASDARPSTSSMPRLVAAGFDIGELGAPLVDRGLRTRQRRMDVFLHIRPVDSQQGVLKPGGRRDVRPWLDLRVRRNQGLSIPEVAFRQLQDRVMFSSDPVYGAGANGMTWQAGAGLDWRSGDSRMHSGPSSAGTRFRVSAHVRGVFSGTEPFRIAVSGLPRYDLNAAMGWNGSSRLGAEISARLEGPRTWRMYEQTRFGERPMQTRLDVALWKRIAGDSTVLTLGVRNLLDTPWRIHPAGIEEQLSVRAGMSVTFNQRTP